MMILKNPAETFAKFREKPPRSQMVTLAVTLWLGISSYIFSYLGLELYGAKISQYVLYSALLFLVIIFSFMFFSMALYFNARLLFGEGSPGAIFVSIFYAFLSVLLFLVLPVQLLSFVIVPGQYEYWFSIIVRSFIVSYYAILVLVAVKSVFKISFARSFAAFLAVFSYIAFFIFSAIYISRVYNIPLY